MKSTLEATLLPQSTRQILISVSIFFLTFFADVFLQFTHLALLKPYYLKLEVIDYSTTPEKVNIKEAAYSRADSALFMNPNRIFGASTWSKSLNKIDYVPGAFFDAAIAITLGRSKTFVQCITLGCNASIYYKPLPIMQAKQAYPLEVCLFAGLVIGKRW